MNRAATGTDIRLRVGVSAFAVSLAFASLLVLDESQRLVALPMYTVVAIASIFVAYVWQQDRAPPYVDVGVVCVLATSVYLVYPLLVFLVSGLSFTEFSDNRLWADLRQNR